MITILLAVLIPLTYAAGWLAFARWYYQLKRPFTEPLGCETPSTCAGGHRYGSCYHRPGSLIGSAREAAACSLLLGAIWPAVLLAFGAVRTVTAGLSVASRPLPEETAAKTKRLERELGMRDR